MADTRVVDLDADFVGAGRQDLDLLNGEVLAGFPGHSGLFFRQRGGSWACWEQLVSSCADFKTRSLLSASIRTITRVAALTADPHAKSCNRRRSLGAESWLEGARENGEVAVCGRWI